MENRIIELETRVAFQEATIQELNEALLAQRASLERLESEVIRLAERLRALTPSPVGEEGGGEPPPHY